MTVNFKFAIGQRVKIEALEGATAIVEMQRNSSIGKDYYVAWWHEGKRICDWLRQDELEE